MEKSVREPLDQQAYNHLLSAILNGEYGADTQLDERSLSRQMGISRTPVRSAISQLVRQGLVEYFPYRGNFVKSWTKQQVNDLFQVRIALEVLAIQLVIPKLSDEDIAEIEAILGEVETAVMDNDLESLGEADARFHQTISQKTRNQTLMEMLDRIALQVQMIRNIANQDPTLVERTLRERPQILAALKARDTDAAMELMRLHIDGVRRAVLEQLE